MRSSRLQESKSAPRPVYFRASPKVSPNTRTGYTAARVGHGVLGDFSRRLRLSISYETPSREIVGAQQDRCTAVAFDLDSFEKKQELFVFFVKPSQNGPFWINLVGFCFEKKRTRRKRAIRAGTRRQPRHAFQEKGSWDSRTAMAFASQLH